MICLPLPFWVLHAVPPLPVVGFSMGVLGTSAVFSGPGGQPWPNCIKQAVFLARLCLCSLQGSSRALCFRWALHPCRAHQALPLTCHVGLAKGLFKGLPGSHAEARIVLRCHVSLILGTSPKMMSSEGQSPGAHCTGVNKPYIQDSCVPLSPLPSECLELLLHH